MPPASADKLTHQIASDFSQADLDDNNKALCEFAQRLTRLPHAMTENDIIQLRENGFSDAAIHDASQVVSYFNYINRIADSLSVDLEDEVHAWELSAPAQP